MTPHHLFHMKGEGSILITSVSTWCGGWCSLGSPHPTGRMPLSGTPSHPLRSRLDIYWVKIKKRPKHACIKFLKSSFFQKKSICKPKKKDLLTFVNVSLPHRIIYWLQMEICITFPHIVAAKTSERNGDLKLFTTFCFVINFVSKKSLIFC